MRKILRTLTLLTLFVASRAHAQVSIDFPTNFAGFSSQDVKITIENVIRIILGFLGVFAIVAVIFGGFLIITSGGDSDRTGNGRKVVVAGLIGLVIVLAAYAISSFVINSIQGAV